MRALLALVGLVAVASGCSSGSTVADAPAQAGGRAAAGAAGTVKVSAGAAGSSAAGFPSETAGVPPVEAAGDPNVAGAPGAAGSDPGGAAGSAGVGGEAGASSGLGGAGAPSGGAGTAGVAGAGAPQGGAGVAGSSSAGAGAGDGGTAGGGAAGVAGGAGSAGAGGGLSAACTPTIAKYTDAVAGVDAVVYDRYLTFSCSYSDAWICRNRDPFDRSPTDTVKNPWKLRSECGAYRAGPYCDSVLWTGDTFGKMQLRQPGGWYICIQDTCATDQSSLFWWHIQGC